MKFRKDINGLRAIAVIAVVLFHFNSSWVPGGFAGVDVFFVISGFLMTGIIFSGLENGNFSVIKFYNARGKRIIPALSIVCFFVLIFGWFNLYESNYTNLTKQIISSLGFLSNFYFWKHSGYFSPGANSNLLLHTWSLSVEWQFYMLYPLFLALSSKFVSLKNLKIVILILLPIGFAFSVFASPKFVSSSYYLLPTRAWEMMLGGVAYIYPFTLKSTASKVLEQLGLLLIIFSCYFISKDVAWPGYLAIFPVTGVFLVIQAQRNSSIFTGNYLLQKIGASSYSIYLWHWPFYVILNKYINNNYYVSILGITLSLIFGFMSYLIIEKKGFNKFIISIIFLTLLSSILIAYSDNIHYKYRELSRVPENVLISHYQKTNKEGEPWIENLCKNNCKQGGVFLWGDSHAHALAFGLKKLLDADEYTALTTTACAPSILYPKYFLESRVLCNNNNIKALNQIQMQKPDIVILARRFKHEDTPWKEITEKIKSLGAKRVIVLGPVLQFKGDLPTLVARKYMKDDYININDMDQGIFKTNILVENIEYKNFMYINLVNSLCDKKKCLVKTKTGDNFSLISFDYGHLSNHGSEFIVNKFLKSHIDSM